MAEALGTINIDVGKQCDPAVVVALHRSLPRVMKYTSAWSTSEWGSRPLLSAEAVVKDALFSWSALDR